jgi:type VII secretion-associated serine protease mycosin
MAYVWYSWRAPTRPVDTRAGRDNAYAAAEPTAVLRSLLVSAHIRRRGRPRTMWTLLLVLLAAALAGSLVAPAVAAAEPVAPPRDQLAALGAERAWQHSTGAGVIVAVLDSGVDADHPDLADRVLPGKDYVDGSTDGREDPVGHGTAVASLIAGAGGTGLAPQARILPVRVLDEDNRYDSSATVAEGVIWAVEQGAQVINLSLGGRGRSEKLSEAIGYAIANDVVVVACAGNASEDGPEVVWYPAREPGVIAVAGLISSDGAGAHWPRSLAGPETVLAAPAVLVGARPGGGYRRVQGTSFSSALVAASAALVRSRWPEASAGEVVHRLVATARDLGEPGRDPRYGYGALDPVAALTAEVPPVRANPLDTLARHGESRLRSAPWRVERRPDLLPLDGVVEIAGGVPPNRSGTVHADRTGPDGFRAEQVASDGPATPPAPPDDADTATAPLTATAAWLVPGGHSGAAVVGLAGLALALLLRARLREQHPGVW